MYKANVTIILFVFFVSRISVNCGHCDDEDYTKEKKENLNGKKADTLTFKNSA